jgi:hypothetical protein
MATQKRRRKLPATTRAEGKRIVDLMDESILSYSGVADEIEQAIGFYFIGRHVGWKALVIMHNKRTIRKYEAALGIDIRKEFDEVGPDAARSLGYRIASQVSNFWKAVSGEEKIPDRRLLG